MDSKRECIQVSVRIRPLLCQDNTSSCLQIISKDPPVLVVLDKPQTYHFDNIFPDDADQENIYDCTVKPLVENVKLGYSCTVFAYGQTGTGKTYTMGTSSKCSPDLLDTGIIPRALDQLFKENDVNDDQEIEILISFSEIYNEKVYDLFQPDKKSPLPVSGFVVQGLSVKNVLNIQEAIALLDLGNKHRHTGDTKQNSNSSRSHAIFTVHFNQKNGDQVTAGKLNLVDLAGSESVKKTGSKGNTFQEGININKGLLSIGQVISALSMKSSYVPYRQSMITSILQGSLNIDNYISLIACVSSNSEDITETLQTLDFAQRAKRIRSNPEVNQIIAKYKKEHLGMFSSIKTPLKRASATPFRTPGIKKMALVPLPLIDESRQSNVESSKSQLSDISSVSSRIGTNTDLSQQAISPVIRKYITKMEVSIVDRLESVLRNTLRRPTRSSLQATFTEDARNKENTPIVSWNKLQNTVTKLVRNEIAQITGQSVRATSSPIEDSEKPKFGRLLNYDSPETMDQTNNSTETSPPKESQNQKFSFKVPKAPVVKEKSKRPVKLSINNSISPIDCELPKVIPRRSLRLSLKRGHDQEEDDTSSELEVSFDTNKRNVNNAYHNESALLDETLPLNDTEDTNSLIITVKKKIHQNDSINTVHRSNKNSVRRSVRIARKSILTNLCESPLNFNEKSKNILYNIAKTPSKILTDRAIKKLENTYSPYTAHSKKVLQVLNQGSLRDLEKLHSVGTKTAEQILLFRKLKGCFDEIKDILNMPGWGPKKFEKFVTLNFLRKD